MEEGLETNEIEQKQFLSLLGIVLCHVRYLAWLGNCKQAGDLADAFHNIPNVLLSEQSTIEFLKQELQPYHEKYGMVLHEGREFDYVKFIKEHIS